MTPKLGEQVILVDRLDDPQIRTGQVTRIKGDTCQIDGDPDHWVYTTYLWPIRVEAELVAVLTERQRLKKAYDDSMALVYELSNRIARGDL